MVSIDTWRMTPELRLWTGRGTFPVTRRNQAPCVSGGMRLVQCGGPIGAGPPEIDGGEPWPYSIKILDCWFLGDRVYRLAVEGCAIPLFASESFRTVLAVKGFATPRLQTGAPLTAAGRSEKRSQLRGNGARMGMRRSS